MRRALALLPLLLFGCKPSRLAAVSNDGRVASTVVSGTSIAGRGRVAEGGIALAWSPDGQTLAIAAKDGVLFWPKGNRLAGLTAPLAWSPTGDRLAGMGEKGVEVRDLASGARTLGAPGTMPERLRWTANGRVLVVQAHSLDIEGKIVQRSAGTILDAMPRADGSVGWLESGPTKTPTGILTAPLLHGRWDLATGGVTVTKIATMSTLLGVASARRLTIPTRFALSPDGDRYAVAGIFVEAGTRSLDRMRALTDKAKPTPVERNELARLSKAARKRSFVVRFSAVGVRTTVWNETIASEEDGPTDLAWSPDGRWLAVARNSGTVRIAAGE